MARAKDVKKLKDELGFSEAIDKLRSEKVDERSVALSGVSSPIQLEYP